MFKVVDCTRELWDQAPDSGYHKDREVIVKVRGAPGKDNVPVNDTEDAEPDEYVEFFGRSEHADQYLPR
jgi:hypothetical protein